MADNTTVDALIESIILNKSLKRDSAIHYALGVLGSMVSESELRSFIDYLNKGN